MRMVLAEYIKENKDKIYNTESQVQLGNLLPINFISNSRFDFDSFFEDYLLNMHMEAEKIIIYLSPIVFEIDMKLFILEGTVSSNHDKLFFHKQEFPCLMPNSVKKISLFYRFSHYDKFYSKENISIYDKHLTGFIIPTLEEGGSLCIKILENTTCEKCHSNNAEIVEFSHIQNFSICKVCLVKYINKLMIIRVKYFFNENCTNRECNLPDLFSSLLQANCN